MTKAKRRVTLSICGLGWLDETEVESIPASAKRPAPPAPNVMLPPHNTETGEVIDESVSGDAEPAPVPPPQQSPAGAGTLSDEQLETMAREAAARGRGVFDTFYKGRPRDEQAKLRAMKAELKALMTIDG